MIWLIEKVKQILESLWKNKFFFNIAPPKTCIIWSLCKNISICDMILIFFKIFLLKLILLRHNLKNCAKTFIFDMISNFVSSFFAKFSFLMSVPVQTKSLSLFFCLVNFSGANSIPGTTFGLWYSCAGTSVSLHFYVGVSFLFFFFKLRTAQETVNKHQLIQNSSSQLPVL